jgi:large subunit ribosomal protein L3
MKGLIGKKVGMTQIYQEDGTRIPVTVLEAGPCRVIAQRTEERDGYSALQIGFGSRKPKNVSKAIRTQAEAAGYTDVAPERIREIRLGSDPEQAVGDELTCEIFAEGEFVDVTGTTKGRGFQGVVKRHNFGGGRASHGGDWTRRGGSIGMCEFPARVYKGRKMPGQHGNVRRTVQNLEIIQVRPEDNAILVKGAIPGPKGGFVLIRQARKKGEVTK